MFNWYLSTYESLNTWLFAGTAVLGSYQDLILTLVSTTICLGAVAFPFGVVFALIKRLFTWWTL